MIIQMANTKLQARHAAVEQAERQEKLTVRVQRPEPRTDKKRDMLEVTDEARRAGETSSEDDGLEPRLRVVKMLLERLTGKPFTVFSPAEAARKQEEVRQANGGNRQGWSAEYEVRESYYEAEYTEFSASGTVKTADGRDITFDLSLSMSREYAVETGFSLRMGDPVDPLVVNFDGTAAELTSTKFAFDLDSDGTEENISFVRPGSGFLAFDRNSDRVVNNGSELFGPATGNGFEELRAYDGDGNNWIDELDDIYEHLHVWAKDHDGRDTLHSLSSRQIGALFLGSAETPFALTREDNQRVGQVVSSGVYLKEDGTPGSLQQVNLIL